MARGSRGNGKTPGSERPSAPLQPTQPSLPLPSSPSSPSSPSDITMELDTPESLASTGPKSVKASITDSQDTQGLGNLSFSDGEKTPTQATEDREHSAKSKKRRRKAKKTKAQEMGSLTPTMSPDILPLDYSGPMPAPATSRRGPPSTSPKPNAGSSPIPPPLAFVEPTKAEETLRQENKELRRELEAASLLAKGLKEANFQLEEEVETWKQKCEGFSEAVKELRTEVEGMINSRLSKFFDQMEEGKEEGREEEKKVKEREEKEGKEEERKKREREEKGGNKEGKGKGKGKTKKGKKEKEEENKGGKDKDGKEGGGQAKEAELKARQEKNLQSSYEQIKAYRQRKQEEERRRKKGWTRFHMKPSRTFWRRVVMTLFLLGLITLLLAPFVLMAIEDIQAYSRAHARRVKRLELKESRNAQLAKAVAQFAADLSPEPIRGILYHSFLNDGWDLEEAY